MAIVKKIINKLHLSELVYRIESKCKTKPINISFQTANEALSYLHKQHPDTGQSCIISRELPSSDCDLEIIVPCYNVEKYVEECINSILEQETKYSFFVTIINDGSHDGTRDKLQKYKDVDNLRIIDQNNQGHSGARNKGIGQAHGRYLMFVDSDDVLLPGAIEELMSLAEIYNADVVDSGHIRFADRSNKDMLSRLKAVIYDSLQKPQALPYNTSAPFITGYPWGKILKKELFSKVQFPLNYWFEDTIVWMILEPLCARKVTTDKLSYIYRMNPNSISHVSYKNNKSIDSLYITLRLLKDRERIGIQFDLNQYENLLQQIRNNFCRIANLDSKIKQAVFVVQQDLISNKFRNWKTNNRKVKPIEDYLRLGDYSSFELWCKWH